MYQRVIPRDFFNEAKLLNCLGKFSIAIISNNQLGFVEDFDGEPFDIQQSEDGSLYVSNYSVYLDEEFVDLHMHYNQKDTKYPLMAYWQGNNYRVLDEEGKLVFEREDEI